ncbi:heme exporter protein CcmD [Paraglaciecola sp.]|uniref:heme exporter protein CcmD n=1 Tax=Paraglaciecola sp. TaxID=1920173 RepID=UPI0030F3BC22
MQFDTMSDFINMGGYALYVWLAFGLGLLSVVGLWLESWRTKKRLWAQVITEQKRQQRIKQAAQQQVS